VRHLRALAAHDRRMRKLLPLLAAAVALAAPTTASAAAVALPPTVDIGLPFWCDWGYDWDERCYRDDGPRLPVGGVDDKVWRSAFRFTVSAVPAGSTIHSATLRLFHDGTCVAPRLASTRCSGRAYALTAHRILESDWYRDQEPALDFTAAGDAWLDDSAATEWVTFDLTGLVRGWHRGTIANDGLVVKLSDDEESYETSGPYLASTSFGTVSARPALVVHYTPPAR
jgi:hypothetical protein